MDKSRKAPVSPARAPSRATKIEAPPERLGLAAGSDLFWLKGTGRAIKLTAQELRERELQAELVKQGKSPFLVPPPMPIREAEPSTEDRAAYDASFWPLRVVASWVAFGKVSRIRQIKVPGQPWSDDDRAGLPWLRRDYEARVLMRLQDGSLTAWVKHAAQPAGRWSAGNSLRDLRLWREVDGAMFERADVLRFWKDDGTEKPPTKPRKPGRDTAATDAGIIALAQEGIHPPCSDRKQGKVAMRSYQRRLAREMHTSEEEAPSRQTINRRYRALAGDHRIP